jgi:hypothetical protein
VSEEIMGTEITRAVEQVEKKLNKARNAINQVEWSASSLSHLNNIAGEMLRIIDQQIQRANIIPIPKRNQTENRKISNDL